MGDASEMSQDDLDKLFDMDSDVDDIAEDDEADDMAAAMEADAEADDSDDDVLELTEELAIPDDEDSMEAAMEIVEGLAEDFDTPGGDVSFAETSDFDEEPEPSYMARPVPEDLPSMADDGPLTSDNTGEAVHAAFDNLANLFVGSQAQTVEELVKEMLRPMLKAWLDQNLPGMVEQMVQKEIQRVTRRR
ncbi:DUF2497 domain-containing protein [Roseibium salinum]|nr:DUF2497 domain-containing protein [Roseibium salinum]